jgi:hypothetical protein
MPRGRWAMMGDLAPVVVSAAAPVRVGVEWVNIRFRHGERIALADTTLTAQLHTIEVDHDVSTGSFLLLLVTRSSWRTGGCRGRPWLVD